MAALARSDTSTLGRWWWTVGFVCGMRSQNEMLFLPSCFYQKPDGRKMGVEKKTRNWRWKHDEC